MNKEILRKEFSYRMSRSSGKGGQHVNKVSTRVEVIFNVATSAAINEQERNRIRKNLGNRINSKNEIQVVCQSTRSQLKNKNFAVAKLIDMLKKALVVQAQRKPSRISRSINEKRLKSKRINKEKKEMRRKDFF